MAYHLEQGAEAEQLACRYLQARGLKLLARNFRCRLGEIDLIMEDETQLVFVEVRCRRSRRFGHPLDTIGRRKQRRISLTAGYFLGARRDLRHRRCRFDVVAVTTGERAGIRWIRNAFMAHFSEL